MKPSYRILLQLMLLCLVVCLVYSPVFLAEPCLLDDAALLQGLQGDARLDINKILTPGSAFAYFRPMISLSYWCSKTLWDASSLAMHIENVTFHVINAILIFWLIRISLTEDTKKTLRYLPLLGALLFAVHPVATESVNWIVGRTDLITGLFLFSTTIAIVVWHRNQKNWSLLLFAPLLLACAILTKETAWGFMIVLPLLLTAPYNSREHTLGEFVGMFTRLERLLILTAIALCFFLAALLLSFYPVIVLSALLGLVVLYRKYRRHPMSRKAYLLITGLLLIISALVPYCVELAHQNASGNYFSKYSRTILLISFDFDNSIARFSAALAFYIKKLFLPLPLSFAITDIATGYLFAGIAVIILVAFLFAWRSLAAILFLAGIVLILPVLPLLHGQIAWTPYAERYIYISSGFWIASLSIGLGSLKHYSIRVSCAALCAVLIPVAAIITYKRSIVWQSNVTLFGDTAQKSPNHFDTRMLYMSALLKADRLPEALEQYRRTQAAVPYVRPKYIKELAEGLYNRGLKLEAWEVLETTIIKSQSSGITHPLKIDNWQRMYKLHEKLRMELYPDLKSSLELNSE